MLLERPNSSTDVPGGWLMMVPDVSSWMRQKASTLKSALPRKAALRRTWTASPPLKPEGVGVAVTLVGAPAAAAAGVGTAVATSSPAATGVTGAAPLPRLGT